MTHQWQEIGIWIFLFLINCQKTVFLCSSNSNFYGLLVVINDLLPLLFLSSIIAFEHNGVTTKGRGHLHTRQLGADTWTRDYWTQHIVIPMCMGVGIRPETFSKVIKIQYCLEGTETPIDLLTDYGVITHKRDKFLEKNNIQSRKIAEPRPSKISFIKTLNLVELLGTTHRTWSNTGYRILARGVQ